MSDEQKATTEMDELEKVQGKSVYMTLVIPVCLWDNVQTETSKRKKCVKAIKERKHR